MTAAMPPPSMGDERGSVGGGVAGPNRGGAGGAMAYWTDSGPEGGPLPWQARDEPRAIGVLGSPHDACPIGSALQVGRTEDGIAIWSIAVGGRQLPGRWIVVGREFLPKRG